MTCSPSNPAGCFGDVIGGGISNIAGGAFNSMVKAFSASAEMLLGRLAKAFVAFPAVTLDSDAVRGVYAMCLGIAGAVAVFLLLGQVIRTVLTHDGSAMAQGLTGVGKAALAFMLTLVIATTALRASDEIAAYIIKRSFGSTKALSTRLGKVVTYSGQITQAPALLLILAIVGILLALILWFELLLRNAAIAVLVATSPIAAAGQVSESTRAWWTKMVTATAQLIFLKPVIALVFAIGFSLTGESDDIQTLLSGMLVLILAVFAWPAIARFFAWASVEVGGTAGLGSLLGVAAGKTGGGDGAPSGPRPDTFSQDAEARTMQGGGAGQAGAAAAGAGTAGVLAAAGKVVDTAQKAVNALSGGMDQMAGHAGLGGRPAGYAAGPPGHGRRHDGRQHGSPPGPEPIRHPDARQPEVEPPVPEPFPDAEPPPDPEPEFDHSPPPDPPTQDGDQR
ncbi:conjugal transfer protein TrbL family protein [Actinomadura atramentaria]|uniref:conjugal transfer protein TrbL family protein n=1 Tax=Actinomadura atramentaria TaxID=1990 RepID=UPI00039A7267|nr:conjugal transfer protein TrbL family protein [Actinomadura atramentaria]